MLDIDLILTTKLRACVQGLWLSRLMSMFGDKEARILVLGLDNAGKTTILCKCRQCYGVDCLVLADQAST